MSLKKTLKKLLWRAGFDIKKFTPTTHALARRKHILDYYQIDTVLDVGANTGQWATELRHDLGYQHRIVSFEPLSTAFNLLSKNAEHDQNWDVFPFGLGNVSEFLEINVAANSQSSSMLGMLPAHVQSAPTSEYVGKERIEVKRLDSIFHSICSPQNRVYLKIDTQGFEEQVIDGAEGVLPLIDTIQVELSLVPLYDGELLIEEMCAKLRGKGYDLIALEESGFSDETTGHLLQVDAIFHRS